MNDLRRYWIQFDATQATLPIGLGHGCGVTAYDYSDAVALLKDRVFGGESPPEAKNIVEDIDVSTLDAGHVLPNMSDPSTRGVWFPLGYS